MVALAWSLKVTSIATKATTLSGNCILEKIFDTFASVPETLSWPSEKYNPNANFPRPKIVRCGAQFSHQMKDLCASLDRYGLGAASLAGAALFGALRLQRISMSRMTRSLLF